MLLVNDIWRSCEYSEGAFPLTWLARLTGLEQSTENFWPSLIWQQASVSRLITPLR